jgi:hypothetical protein
MQQPGFIVECENCRTRYVLPFGANPANFHCGNCGHPRLILPVPPRPADNPALPLGGAAGGAALGGAIAGPVGAVVGGFIGLLVGIAAAKR